MSLKLLLDENVSPVVVKGLLRAGYDSVHVRDVGLRGKKDPEVLGFATHAGRYLVTLDADTNE